MPEGFWWKSNRKAPFRLLGKRLRTFMEGKGKGSDRLQPFWPTGKRPSREGCAPKRKGAGGEKKSRTCKRPGLFRGGREAKCRVPSPQVNPGRHKPGGKNILASKRIGSSKGRGGGANLSDSSPRKKSRAFRASVALLEKHGKVIDRDGSTGSADLEIRSPSSRVLGLIGRIINPQASGPQEMEGLPVWVGGLGGHQGGKSTRASVANLDGYEGRSPSHWARE